jgi:hypothetical protein
MKVEIGQKISTTRYNRPIFLKFVLYTLII